LAYGKEGEKVEYDLPNIEFRISRDIQTTRRRIQGMSKALEAKK